MEFRYNSAMPCRNHMQQAQGLRNPDVPMHMLLPDGKFAIGVDRQLQEFQEQEQQQSGRVVVWADPLRPEHPERVRITSIFRLFVLANMPITFIIEITAAVQLNALADRGEVFLIFSSISPGAFRILMTFLFFAVKCMALFGVHRNNGICTHTALTLASALVCLNLCLLQSTLQLISVLFDCVFIELLRRVRLLSVGRWFSASR